MSTFVPILLVGHMCPIFTKQQYFDTYCQCLSALFIVQRVAYKIFGIGNSVNTWFITVFLIYVEHEQLTL